MVPKEFAEEVLVRMAGYRVRLVHFYAEVTPREMHAILTEHLDHTETFSRYIRTLLEHPELLGLAVE